MPTTPTEQLTFPFYDPEDCFPSHAPERTMMEACALAKVPPPSSPEEVPTTYLHLLVAGVDHQDVGRWWWREICLDGAPGERRISRPLGRGWRERLGAPD